MNDLTLRLAELGPEITLLIGAVVCMMIGLSSSLEVRRLTAWVAAVALVLAGMMIFLATNNGPDGSSAWDMPRYVKAATAGIGLLLLMLASRVPDALQMTRDAEAGREPFDAGNVMRGEFFAFFLISLTGVMLCAGAPDLVWLFLALELTSLPTYVMVVTSRDQQDASESGVKYFFLGAMAAAVFLYGFTLIYGATGVTEFDKIRQFIAVSGVTPLMAAGMTLAIIGVSFKIAAVPMHFYAADVYQGATTPVTAFLAFVPKTAGFVSLILLLGLVAGTAPGSSGGLPPTVVITLVVMAALTMTVGYVLGLLQTNVKRVLAYSSIAHSGYMLVGLLAFMSKPSDHTLGNGIAAVLFYLVAYGLANLAAFAVLGCLESNGDEAQSFDDLSGLHKRRPGLAAIMLLANLSLIGLPPMIGFVGKIYLFGSAIEHGYIGLVIVAVVNSAISAVYYLRIVSACYFGDPSESSDIIDLPLRRMAAGIAVALALILGVAGDRLVKASRDATVAASTEVRPRPRAFRLRADANLAPVDVTHADTLK